jgi:very-short-patch-repair endonuclease
MVINGSNMKVWWICPTKKHSYKSSINSRCKINSGCPLCYNKTEGQLLDFLKKHYPDVFTQLKLDNCKNIYRCRYDVCIPSLKIIIEIDGPQHFKQVSNWDPPEKTRKNDIYKMQKAEAEGYKVIRIFQEDVYDNDEKWLETNLLPEIQNEDRTPVFISSIEDLYDEHIRVYESGIIISL